MKIVENIALLNNSAVGGVEICFTENSTVEIYAILVKKRKSKIEIIEKIPEINEPEKLRSFINTSVPLTVSFSGKGLIFKTIPTEADDQQMLSRIFPNVDHESFYVQKYFISEKESLVAIMRKDLSDTVIETLKSYGFLISSITLGPLNIDLLADTLHTETFFTRYYTIHFRDNEIYEISEGNMTGDLPDIKTGSESIPAGLVVPFSNAISHFTSNTRVEYEGIAPPHDKESIIYKTALAFSGWAVLVFVFFFLLVNFMFFSHFNKKMVTLQAELGYNSTLIDKMAGLQDEYTFKKDLIEKSGLLKSTKLSYYADRIALNLSDGIYLSEININPVKEKIKSLEEIQFDINKIVVSGNAKNSLILNNWIKILKKENWIKTLKLVEYNQENTIQPGEFLIEVELNS